jgi:hypothetical protein
MMWWQVILAYLKNANRNNKGKSSKKFMLYIFDDDSGQ